MLDVVICGDLCGDRARCALKGCIKNLLDSCGMLRVHALYESREKNLYLH